MARIALVDDDRNILTSVSMTLEAEGFEVETYNDGQSALDAFNRRLPDMAVLDIKMPRMDGMDLLQRLRQKTTMPVIFLTSKDDEIDEVLGLRMGADDYVKKPFSQGLLVERIRALLRRRTPEALDTAVELAGLVLDPSTRRVSKSGIELKLGPTEFRLLEFLMQGPGRVFSREQLLKHPAVVLHELAHAYHDQILSFDQPEILAAYQKAKAAGIYENVLLYTGKKVKHYGLTNHKEYFAEGTEAFFYRNDFYPFVRAELKEHDPILHDVLARVWGVVANPTAPSPAGTSPDLKSGSGK